MACMLAKKKLTRCSSRKASSDFCIQISALRLSIDSYFSIIPTFFCVLTAWSCRRQAALDAEYFWSSVSNISLGSENSRMVANRVLSTLIKYFFFPCSKPISYVSFSPIHDSNILLERKGDSVNAHDKKGVKWYFGLK